MPLTPVVDYATAQPEQQSREIDAPSQEFTEYLPPTQDELRQAATFELLDENGKTVWFRELYPDRPGAATTSAGDSTGFTQADDRQQEPKTVVFFIRALGCGQCQDYMLASISRLDPDEIAAEQVRVVIITNGSWKGVSRYRELMGSKFPIYVDPELKLYRLLG